MGADPHRLGQRFQIRHGPLEQQPRKRLDVRRPFLRVRIVPRLQLGIDAEQPRPTVRALERFVAVFAEERHLAVDGVGREMLVQLFPNQPCQGQIGKHLQDLHHRPGRIDRRMPVEAAVEGPCFVKAGRQRDGRLVEVPAAPRRVVQLVDARERQRDEPHRGVPVERDGTVAAVRRVRGRRRRAGEQDTEREGDAANIRDRHGSSSPEHSPYEPDGHFRLAAGARARGDPERRRHRIRPQP